MHFQIPRGELLHPVSDELYDPAQPDATLEGATVRFVMLRPGEQEPVIDNPARVVDASTNVVAYDWVAGETDEAGVYLYQWKVDRPDAPEQSYPPTPTLLEIIEQYATPAGNTPQGFADFHDAAEGGNPTTIRRTLELASDTVAGMIEPPTDESQRPDFVRRLRNAELFVARWIWDTDAGATSSKASLVGSSISYQSNPAVQGLVASSMGPFAKDPDEVVGGGSDDGTAYVGRL